MNRVRKYSTYAYYANGRLTRRIWARGIVTTYSYDAWGSLMRTDYSGDTPSVALAYDAMGRETRATDAAGVTTFAYDAFGANTNETVVGVAGTNTIGRFYDTFGRDAGYALNGVRQSTIAYDPVTGRLVTMLAAGSDTPFTWSYLAGRDFKSSLTYPSGLIASWSYGKLGELLEVNNVSPTGAISKYVYTYDASGRRIGCVKSGSAFEADDTLAYLYNARSELTNATAAADAAYRYDYAFDDIGNREAASESGNNTSYAANALNQYTSVGPGLRAAPQAVNFMPTYDADGNQTLVKTATGIWSIAYNGENRPIRWTSLESNNQAIITMSDDRRGRRVTKNDQRFVYNGYVQIADNSGNTYVWDFAENVATRSLVWNRGDSAAYYTYDGDKNVSEVVISNYDFTAHYEYAPFGALTVSSGKSAAANPWRFSSEYAEDDMATFYYNYRHYEPVMGRWMQRDPIEDIDVVVSSNDGNERQDNDSDFRDYLLRFAKVSFLYGDMAGCDKAMKVYFEYIAGELETKSDNYSRSLFNLYSHVGNAPYMRFDELGLVGYWVVGYPAATACALADGPLPIGDIIGLGILVCCAVAAPPTPPKCPDPPSPPKPQVHYKPNQHGCPYAHWHKFEVNQAPWPLCKTSIKRSLGGCIPPKPGQPAPPIN